MFRTTVVLLLTSSAFAQTGGAIRARFADSAGAAVVAEVRVLDPKDGAAVFHGNAEATGTLRISALKPGAYRLIARAAGFRRVDLPSVRVEAGKVVDLGTLEMDFSGCDAPGISCSYYGTGDQPIDWHAELGNYRRSVQLRGLCGIDLDNEARTVCPQPGRARNWKKRAGIELQLIEAKGRRYLEAMNGAAISVPNTSDGRCGDARFTESRLLVDDLGKGVDFCARSARGAIAHVFLSEEVDRGSESVALWVVTRSH